MAKKAARLPMPMKKGKHKMNGMMMSDAEMNQMMGKARPKTKRKKKKGNK